MYQTLEIRWFGDEPLGEADLGWFESLGEDNFRRHEERTDQYVALPGVMDLGVKFRGDIGVDVKARTEEIGIVELRFSDEMIAGGRVESWAKWTYQGPEYVGLGGVLSRLDVIEVKKRRWQYVFGLPEAALGEERAPGDGAFMIDLGTDPAPQAERGMILELAEIECQGRELWTLGIEAFPGGPNLGSDMLAAALPALRSCPLALTAESSSGYPAWLASLGAS